MTFLNVLVFLEHVAPPQSIPGLRRLFFVPENPAPAKPPPVQAVLN